MNKDRTRITLKKVGDWGILLSKFCLYTVSRLVHPFAFFDRDEKQRIKVLPIVTIILTAITLYVAYVQLGAAVVQLQQLNAKSKIELNFHFATSTIKYGPVVTEPIEIVVVPRNRGDYNTSMWSASLIFCPDVYIADSPANWVKIDPNIFIYRSQDKVLSEQSFFSDQIDSIGKFEISLQTNKLSRPGAKLPMGIYTTSGEKSVPVNNFVYLNPENGLHFQNVPFLFGDEKFRENKFECFNVDDRTKGNSK